MSPLTAVDAYYLVPGGELLTVYRTAPAQLGAGMHAARVEVEVEDSGANVVRHIVNGELRQQIMSHPTHRQRPNGVAGGR